MRVILPIISIISVLYSVGAVQNKPTPKSAPQKTSLSEPELRTLAKAVPDVNNAGMLYSVAIATTNDIDRQQEYLKAAAACLVACDKIDIYKKHIKGKLLNAAEFEDELKDDCKRCSGTGTKESRCYLCKGSGQCPECKGTGQVKAVKYSGFNKYHVLKPCNKCNQSGRCQKCKGEGTATEKCRTCAGKGKVGSQAVAARVFRDSCNAIADSMAAKVRAKAEAEERERNRKLAEAKAKAEAEERERKRKEEEKKERIEREYMESLGFVNIYGKWMTPGSVRHVRYRVFQIYEPGHALCTDGNRVFCLIYSQDINKDVAEGDIYVNDLYRCGTYSYTTVNNVPSTVAKFAIDVDTALKEIKKH